jgi:23S rRNA (uracil1939-C5)-methyltransferase
MSKPTQAAPEGAPAERAPHAQAAAQPPASAEGSTARPRPGDELELQVESLAFGGEGVARLGEGGYVVFVAGAIPGDRVRAVVYKRKRSYAHARAVEVLVPSPERIPPRAAHPGVAWQVLPYERQLQVKRAQVEEALGRIGGLHGFELLDTLPAIEQWRYRNKLEYSFGAGRDELGREQLICGFHAAAGAKQVAPLEDCLLASERGNRARELTLRWCRSEGLQAWDRGREGRGAGGPGPGAGRAGRARGERPQRPGQASRAQRTGPGPDGRARLRNLVVREGRRSGQLQIRIVTTDGELDVSGLAATLSEALAGSLCGVLWTRSHSPAETTAGGDTELVWGEAQLPEQLGELDLRISGEAFFQTNTEMAEQLYGVIARFAALEGWERVYDLYCGIGAIALTLAPRAGEVWGIELLKEAVADAITGARRNEVTNARFFAGDVRLALPELLTRAGRPDVLVVDPPRAGLSRTVVHRIIDAAPRRIVYVSCNPTTLAPNASELVQAGWTLRRVQPIDMFPQTHHIECVALLERARA